MENKIFRVENLFLIVCLIWGTIFLVLNPPFQSPDEPEHLFKMWGYTEGTLRYQTKNGASGLEVPASFARLYDFYDYYRVSNEKIPFYSTLRSAGLALEKDHKVFLRFNPSSYTPVSYFPAFVVLWVMKIMSVKPLIMMYILRFCSLLVYLALCYAAIRTMPCKKWFLFLFALLPVNVFQACSLSTDGATTGMTSLFLAYTLKLAFDSRVNNITRKQMIAWDVLITLIGLLKFAYLPVILLYFLIPESKFTSKKLYYLNFCVTLLVNVFLIGAFLLGIMLNPPATRYTDAYLVVNKFDLLKEIVLAPFAYLKKLISSTFFLMFFLYQNMISSIGVTLAMISMPLTHLAWFMLVVSVFYKKDTESVIALKWKDRAIIVTALLVSYFVIMTSVYLIYQTQPYIVGIQGRYLSPLIAYALLVILPARFFAKSKLIPVFIFLVSQLLLFQTLVTLLVRYY